MLSFKSKRSALIFSALMFSATSSLVVLNETAKSSQVSVAKTAYIIQGQALSSMVAMVERVGGTISHKLPIINAIGASLTQQQYNKLSASGDLKLSENRKLVSHTANAVLPDYAIETYVVQQSRAHYLHHYDVKGQGVTIATIDSGVSDKYQRGAYLRLDSNGHNRILAKYDALSKTVTTSLNDDTHGHGSHIAGVAVSSVKDSTGRYNGMAPDAKLVSIKAFDGEGDGTYLDVLDGLNWMIENKDRYNIRVVNMSFGSDENGNYWENPINQAVMKAWDAGIVVVTSAGNDGPEKGTITSPGDVPYVITVGAITDNYTPYNFRDERVTTFSSQGPTYNAFVKPEVVSWGGHIRGKINGTLISELEGRYKLADEGGQDYYMVSGTSQAAAVVTGTAALMLSLEPHLTPDTIKCRLIATAHPLTEGVPAKVVSPFKQGAGVADAWNAAMSYDDNCANKGMDIKADLAGTKHYRGQVIVDGAGEFGVVTETGSVMTEGLGWGDLSATSWGQIEGLGWEVSMEGLGWGGNTILEGLSWKVQVEGLGWGGDTTEMEGLGWDGTDMEGLGWDGTEMEGLGWGGDGSKMEGLGWGGDGSELEGLGWEFSIESVAEELPAPPAFDSESSTMEELLPEGQAPVAIKPVI